MHNTVNCPQFTIMTTFHDSTSRPSVEEITETLETHIKHFQEAQEKAGPVIFGDNDTPDAVLMSYGLYEQLLDLLEDDGANEKMLDQMQPGGSESFSLDDAAKILDVDLNNLII